MERILDKRATIPKRAMGRIRRCFKLIFFIMTNTPFLSDLDAYDLKGSDAFDHGVKMFLKTFAGRVSGQDLCGKRSDRCPEIASNALQAGKFRLFQQSSDGRGILHFLGSRRPDIGRSLAAEQKPELLILLFGDPFC